MPFVLRLRPIQVAEKRMQPSGGFHSEAFRTNVVPVNVLDDIRAWFLLEVVRVSVCGPAIVRSCFCDSLAARCFCDTAGG